MKQTAYIRTEASPQIGGGHVMRCLVLANALQEVGWQTIFVTSDESVNHIEVLKTQILISPAVFENSPPQMDLLIIDYYDLGSEYEIKFRDLAKKILVIEDVPQKFHECDYLLNQNLGIQEKDYQGLIPTGCKLLLGPQYALLRPEFSKWRSYSLERRKNLSKIKRIFINFGLSEQTALYKKILQALSNLKEEKYEIDIVLGQKSQEIEGYARTLALNIYIHINPSNLAELMANADLAIGAAGSSSWERCCLGLPTLLFVLAENQRTIAYELEKAGGGLRCNEQDFYENIKILDLNLREQSIISSRQCDGNGYKITLNIITNYEPKNEIMGKI